MWTPGEPPTPYEPPPDPMPASWGGYELPRPHRPPEPMPPPAAPHPATPGTDGVCVAALVTGLLGLGIVPIVLGVVGIASARRRSARGRGMAIAGVVLGVASIVAVWTVVGRLGR